MGLGNPGSQYEGTRHNVGESVIRLWAKERGLTLSRHKTGAFTASMPGEHVVLAITSGFMNTSGGPVAQLAKYFKTPPDKVTVLHDDLDLPLGTIRLKVGGGHGGHNGVRDIQKALGTPEFCRIRLGIGRPPGQMDPAAYVLKPFSAAEKPEVELMSHRAIDAATALVHDGLLAAQQIFHSPGAKG